MGKQEKENLTRSAEKAKQASQGEKRELEKAQMQIREAEKKADVLKKEVQEKVQAVQKMETAKKAVEASVETLKKEVTVAQKGNDEKQKKVELGLKEDIKKSEQ